MSNFETYQSFSQDNFDPNEIANLTSSVIQFVVVLDVSPSISSFYRDMNVALSDIFMKELKGCHRKDDIMVKCITFCDKVVHKSGFMPILNLPDDYLQVTPQGTGTALYKAVKEAMSDVTSYRDELENQGIDVRTNIFIVTDGEDNEDNGSDLSSVNQMISDLRKNEAWAQSFTMSMLGVGDDSSFRRSCTNMGLDPDKVLSTIGTSASEIRKQMGVVSQSVSQSNVGSSVSF
jgi:uncharacterized protein YegL